MDQNERQPDNKVSIDRDAQINVVVNRTGEDETTIDLGRVFHNMKVKRRIFAWVLVLCLVVGVCAPLLMYQFVKPMLTVASAVTLKYDAPMAQQEDGTLIPLASSTEADPVIVWAPVADLSAPDGTALDLSVITSSYVLQEAMKGLELSQPLTLSALKRNISIEKVLTEQSRQVQELASKMVDDKNADAYQQLQNVAMTYDKTFVVRLTNGFGDEDSKVRLELQDDELQLLLDRILSVYNDYLVKTYANLKLPDDKLSVVETANDLDILDRLDQLKEASDALYAYCNNQLDSVKAYRSHRDGRNLYDWMITIQTGREVSIDYLYSDVYTNSIVKERNEMITSYEYQVRNAQTKLDTITKNIANNEAILKDYKNDQIYVSMQESETSRSTKTTTAYYNSLVLQQAAYYNEVAELEIQIADLNDKIAKLKSGDTTTSEETLAEAETELERAIETCRSVFDGVTAHMNELKNSAFYTNYAEHTVPQGKLDNFLLANLKTMIIGAVAGAVIACGLWFLATLAPEFRRNRKEDEEGKEAAEA